MMQKQGGGYKRRLGVWPLQRCSSGAFTLLEMLMAMGLAVMAIAMLSYTTQRMSAAVRLAEERFARKSALIATAEQIRWQLRCLYTGGQDDSQPRPNSHTQPGSLKYEVYGKRSGVANRDYLIFNTTYVPKAHGTVEVGYCILVDAQTQQPYLAYRQFPWVDVHGLHDIVAYEAAPWQVCNRDIVGLSLEFSSDSEVWQQEWTAPEAPLWVRVTLYPREGAPFVTQVITAMPSGRW